MMQNFSSSTQIRFIGSTSAAVASEVEMKRPDCGYKLQLRHLPDSPIMLLYFGRLT